MKILVIRFSSIGDIVLTSPVLRCLKKKFPSSEIHYLTKAQYHPLLAANPHISKYHLLENDLSDTINELKEEKFDVVIDLHKNLRTMRVKNALDVKSYTYDKLNFKKWMKVNLKIDMLPDKHIVDRYFDALEPLGVENDGQGLDYYIWDKEVYDYVNTLSETPYIVFSIGAKHNTKKLPDDKIVAICESLKSRIIILGGKEEEALGARLNELFPAKIVNLAGKVTINESAHLIKHAKKVITFDTGMMHIAAAFKKPILSVWGNTVPEFGMYPYYGERNQLMSQKNSFLFEVEGLSCRPCSKLGYPECPLEHFKCMNDHDLNKIVEVANL